MGFSKSSSPLTPKRLRFVLQALLVVAWSLGQGATGWAQKSVSGIGSIQATTVDQVDATEFVLDAAPDRVQAIATRHGLTILRSLDAHPHGIFLVRAQDGSSLEYLLDQVLADPEVTHFERNALVIPPEVPSGITLNQSPVSILDALSDRSQVSYYGAQAWTGYVSQPAAAAIRLAQVHGTSITGAGIVAIVDTGVDPTHPLLQGALVPGYDFVADTAGQASEWGDVDSSTAAILAQSPVSILDQGSVVPLNQSTVAIMSETTAQSLNTALLPPAFGHGTMVAGLVHLVAPTAKIMPLKAFRADGSSRVFDIVRAIHYAVENGARVINMSFSAEQLSPEITHAINYATANNVICVSSAGNAGRELLVYPAALRNVLGIGSVNSTDPPARSAFTNYGDALVRVAAPGEGVRTTYPGGHYVGAWGTSFSTALASGAVALLLQKNPTLDQPTASDFLGKADRMKNSGMGRGRLNLYDAVRQLPDETAPTVSFVAPTGESAAGTSVAIVASASDNVAVAGVQFLVDGNPLGAEDTAAPYQATWDTTTVTNGPHLLTATARDASGNTTSSTLSVSVSNDLAAPTVALTSPAEGATLSGSVTLAAAAADDSGVASVEFLLDGAALGALATAAPYELIWDTRAATNGVHTVTVVARDVSGKAATASRAITVSNDTTAPNVALTSPTTGATVSGIVTLGAAASDDTAVSSVQFLLDGAPLGPASTAAPYQLSWNSATAADGTHTLTAVALDGAGNSATAATVTVVVTNSTP